MEREKASMIRSELLTDIARSDNWLDGLAGPQYQRQPLAQDWARVSKVIEELGETIAELILYTGQNPRKPQDAMAKERMLKELGDVALTAILAMQHFTKDADLTNQFLSIALAKIASRANQDRRMKEYDRR
jgi:hypothetical protein